MSCMCQSHNHSKLILTDFAIERRNNGVTNCSFVPALNLHLNDGRFKSQLVFVSDDVDSPIRAFWRNTSAISHRSQEVCDEVRERMAFEFLR